MTKQLQNSTDIFGNVVYNTTPEEFIAMVQECFDNKIEICERWGECSDGTEYDYYTYDNDGNEEIVLIEYNESTFTYDNDGNEEIVLIEYNESTLADGLVVAI